MYQQLWYNVKAIFGEKYIVLNEYIRKEERVKVNWVKNTNQQIRRQKIKQINSEKVEE